MENEKMDLVHKATFREPPIINGETNRVGLCVGVGPGRTGAM